jgi:hypothetical protein
MSQINKAEKNESRGSSDERCYRGRRGCHRKAAARGKVDARRSGRRASKAIARAATDAME